MFIAAISHDFPLDRYLVVSAISSEEDFSEGLSRLFAELN